MAFIVYRATIMNSRTGDRHRASFLNLPAVGD